MNFSSNWTLQTLYKIFCNSGTNGTQIKKWYSFGMLRVRSFLSYEHTTHIDEPNEQELLKYWRHNSDWNKFKYKGLFGFMFFPLKLQFSRTVGEIISRGTVLECLEYDISYLRSTRRTSTNPTNRSVANIEDTTLTETSSNIRDSLDLRSFL